MSKPTPPPPSANTIIPRSHFDPWNSSSTGHQQAGSHSLAGSTSWRQSRTSKLAAQFRGGPSGGRRVADSVGAGSPYFGQDGRKPNGGWEKGASGLRRQTGCGDVKEMLMNGNSSMTKSSTTGASKIAGAKNDADEENTWMDSQRRGEITDRTKKIQRKLFDGLCFYINGSTAPMVSDHRLKHLIAENGGRVAIGLARRTVTHVILGKSREMSSSMKKSEGVVVKETKTAFGGAGGGLAAGKLHKEIQRVGGRAIKYVTVEWVLESLRCGKRVAETSYSSAVQMATARTQKNIANMMGTTNLVQTTE
ncbi:MAG: hypothetical protein M1823_002449 [Watsoniomyces obsoletus]|nr:MAG: hypothetical protein M1823_002449 [Watsoniomyces obsoletus]